MSSKSKLNPTNLILDDIGNIITLTSTGSNTLDLEGSSSADVSIIGINNITSSGSFSGNTFIGSNYDNGGVLYITNASGEITTDSNFTYNSGTSTLNITNLNINGESISGMKILFAIDSVGNVPITNGTPATLQYDTTSVNDSGYSLSSGEVTISETGTYEVYYCIVINSNDATSDDRGRLQGFIEVNPNTGSFSTVAGSITSGYMREQNPNITSWFIHKTIPVVISVANSVLRIRFQNSTTSTQGITSPGESTLIIKKIRP